jgi:hypothetical protein
MTSARLDAEQVSTSYVGRRLSIDGPAWKYPSVTGVDMADNEREIDEAELIPAQKPSRSGEEIEKAEGQIVENIKDVRYIVREYPAEVVVSKYLKGKETNESEIYVPDYQRDLIWPQRNQSRFIESLLIGLPIPFLFVADVAAAEDPENAGRLEIVDGVQRIRTLARFLTGDLALSGLERLTALNGFRFSDLHPSRQRRFKRATLRLIELTEGIAEDVRREMFDRINSGSVTLESVEVRRGMEPGPFLALTTELASDPLLHQLAPVSEPLQKRFEYEELVTRFFAFLDRHLEYGKGPEGKVVKDFLLTYVRETNTLLKAEGGEAKTSAMRQEWTRMLAFVKDHFPDGFRKHGPGRKVPRVRFEAISVGVGLALRENPTPPLQETSPWLDGPDFRTWTTSDASNNRANLIGRVEYVRDKILGR